MRLLLFSHSSALGGSERSLLELIDEMQKHKAECLVVLPQHGPLVASLTERHVPYVIIKYSWWCTQEPARREFNYARIVFRLARSAKNLLLAMKKLSAWNPDAIITNTITIPWGVLYSKIMRKPHILLVREYGTIDFGFTFYLEYAWSTRCLINNSAYVVANSQATQLHFQQLAVNHFVDYAYPTVHIHPTELTTHERKIYTKPAALKLIMVGAITAGKGQVVAVHAVNLLVKNGMHVELVIVGNQTDTGYVRMLRGTIADLSLENVVHMMPFTNNPHGLIKQADVVVSGSKNEAFGRVTVEAMLLGKPVVGVQSGGTKELIQDKKTGYLYTFGDYIHLASIIEHISKNKRESQIIVRNALEFSKGLSKKSSAAEKIYQFLKTEIRRKH